MMEFSRAAFELLKTDGLSRAWTGLGGSHTLVTYPPLDALEPLSAESVLPSLSRSGDINLYVHVPFCEMRCAFCAYETQVIAASEPAIDSYLRALTAEMDLISERLCDAQVRSLYIGGGTATVLSSEQLDSVMRDLRRRFAFSPDALICIETSPNALINDSGKIALLQDLGVRRVSVGVQTFSETALQGEGRTHDPAETLQMLETLIRQIEVVNIDLMQDMPGQTDDDLARDIDAVARLQPAQVTWYVERLRKWHGRFPDAYRSVMNRLSIRDRMKELSYRARPGGRFVLAGSGEDAFKSIRCGLSAHLVGLGSSAYSHVPGCFYRNTLSTAEYTRALLNGNSPIALGAAIRKLDRVASRIVSGIRWGVRLEECEPEFEPYIAETKFRLELLMRHGLVRFDPDNAEYSITLDGRGWAYEEEICSMFVPQDIIDRIRARNLPWWFQSTIAALWLAHSVDALSLLL